MAWQFRVQWEAEINNLCPANAVTNVRPEEQFGAYSGVLNELKLLERQKCLACAGFGHQARSCPTQCKLTNIGMGSSTSRH